MIGPQCPCALRARIQSRSRCPHRDTVVSAGGIKRKPTSEPPTRHDQPVRVNLIDESVEIVTFMASQRAGTWRVTVATEIHQHHTIAPVQPRSHIGQIADP